MAKQAVLLLAHGTPETVEQIPGISAQCRQWPPLAAAGH
jgi:hypothetical protein